MHGNREDVRINVLPPLISRSFFGGRPDRLELSSMIMAMLPENPGWNKTVQQSDQRRPVALSVPGS